MKTFSQAVSDTVTVHWPLQCQVLNPDHDEAGDFDDDADVKASDDDNDGEYDENDALVSSLMMMKM